MRLQSSLEEAAQSGGLEDLSSCSSSAATATSFRFAGLPDDERGDTVLLAPCVDLPADAHVGDEYFVLQRLVCEGRRAVLLQSSLNSCAVVGMAVGGDNRVVHQNVVERHVSQLLCSEKASEQRGGR